MAVTISTHEGTRRIVIERPPVNALDLETITQLERSFAAAAQDAPERGLVLTGGGQVFSAGVDTRTFAAYSREQRHAMVLAITRMLARLLAIPAPVVVAVNGHALGGGFVLMLACDYRIAVEIEAAKLGLTEAKAGIAFPAGALEVVRTQLAPDLLRRLTLTSEVQTTRQLLDVRILDCVCPPELLEIRSMAIARSLSAQAGFRTVKRQMRGELAERVAMLAASGRDDLLSEFD